MEVSIYWCNNVIIGTQSGPALLIGHTAWASSHVQFHWKFVTRAPPSAHIKKLQNLSMML